MIPTLTRIAGPNATLISHGDRPWESATFKGMRYTASFLFTSQDEADSFIERLPDYPFDLPGCLVCDAKATKIVASHMHIVVACEVLVLEE